MSADGGGPIFDAQRAAVGAARFEAMMMGNAKLQGMAAMALITAATVPTLGWPDDALEAMRVDAADLRAAADELASVYEALADDWQAQRRTHESAPTPRCRFCDTVKSGPHAPCSSCGELDRPPR